MNIEDESPFVDVENGIVVRGIKLCILLRLRENLHLETK